MESNDIERPLMEHTGETKQNREHTESKTDIERPYFNAPAKENNQVTTPCTNGFRIALLMVVCLPTLTLVCVSLLGYLFGSTINTWGLASLSMNLFPFAFTAAATQIFFGLGLNKEEQQANPTQWTIAITASQDIKAIEGTKVTQGAASGKLTVVLKALKGETTNIIVETEDSVTFNTSTDIIIASRLSGPVITIPADTISSTKKIFSVTIWEKTQYIILGLKLPVVLSAFFMIFPTTWWTKYLSIGFLLFIYIVAWKVFYITVPIVKQAITLNLHSQLALQQFQERLMTKYIFVSIFQIFVFSLFLYPSIINDPLSSNTLPGQFAGDCPTIWGTNCIGNNVTDQYSNGKIPMFIAYATPSWWYGIIVSIIMGVVPILLTIIDASGVFEAARSTGKFNDSIASLMVCLYIIIIIGAFQLPNCMLHPNNDMGKYLPPLEGMQAPWSKFRTIFFISITVVQALIAIFALHLVQSVAKMTENLKDGNDWHFFISYKQANGFDQYSMLRSQLEQRGWSVFIDDDINNKEDGIKKSAVFVLFLTEGIFNEDKNRKEIMWALEFGKPILLIHEKEKEGAIFDFNLVRIKNEISQSIREKILPKVTTIIINNNEETHENSTPNGILNQPGKWDVFLNHTQRNTKAVALAEGLYSSLIKLGKKVWFDIKMDQKSEAAMREGIINSKCVIAVITGVTPDGDAKNAYFKRPFCIKELEWAIEANVQIQPVILNEDKKSIGEFMGQAPAHLKFLGNIDFIDLNRSDKDYWDVGVKKVMKAMNNNLFFTNDMQQMYASGTSMESKISIETDTFLLRCSDTFDHMQELSIPYERKPMFQDVVMNKIKKQFYQSLGMQQFYSKFKAAFGDVDAAVRKAFGDKDEINQKQLMDVTKSLRVKLNPGQVKGIFMSIDADRGGTISKKEFKDWWNRKSRGKL